MPLTLEQSLLDTQLLLNDVHSIVFAPQHLTDWLSQGQRAVAALTLCYQRLAVFASTDMPATIVPGLREYTFEGALGVGGLGLGTAIRVLGLSLGGNSLPLWTGEMVVEADARSAGGGTPRFWYQFGQRLGFVPYPDSAFLASSWTIEALYADLPGEWTTGASVLPSGFDALPTHFAVIRGLLSRRYWQQAVAAHNEFMRLLGSYRQVSLVRITTSRQAIVQPVREERRDVPRLHARRA